MPELPKTYDPKTVEPKWYQRWIADRDFEADPKSPKSAFSIVIPPPNITGVLTLGHVLNNTIQDILARRARMQGFEVLWLPGTDHAGLATQTAVEKWLRKNEGVSRHDLGRNEFVRRVWDWQKKHGHIIIEQLKRLGCSCDWSRERFTLDEAYSRAVQKVFVDLYHKGLIYRGRRMINWDPAAQTALSDEEVTNKPQKGNLYFVRYEIVEERGRFLEVATTRPETIMADMAVAFHPNDRRYADLVGKHVWRPLAREKLPIIADEAIDPEFGTGVLKVTPAHDKLDFEIGQRHNLPIIDVLHPDGRINCPAVRELDGLDRLKAREKAADLLKTYGLLTKAEPYENNVGFSERSEVPIEPRLSEQWFLRYPKTAEALQVVREHLIRFFPAHWEKVYAQWLENIQDWCVSRQVWWGHRIPAWYRKQTSEVGGRRSEVRDLDAEIYVGIEPPSESENWTQDPDTLDTWFSSWLWAYETMDDETREKFYPTSVLVTAPDIIFFWVARMIIAGLEFRPGKSERLEDNIPFRDVFFTGLIRDKQGRKMSKSLGNSPDPLELIDKYGADAVRVGVVGNSPIGHDVIYDEKNLELGRNFSTKLWNAARLRKQHGTASAELDAASLTSLDKWILYTLNKVTKGISKSLDDYELAGAWLQLSGFFWHDFCDWYVEASKAAIASGNAAWKSNTLTILDKVFTYVLRLAHPFIPFITEELWHQLGYDFGFEKEAKSILEANWPEPFEELLAECRINEQSANQGGASVFGVVNRARSLRADFNIATNRRVRFVLVLRQSLDPRDVSVLKTLLVAEPLDLLESYNGPKGTPTASTPIGELYLPLEGLIDVTAERTRIEREISKVEAELQRVHSRLADQSFKSHAPENVVQKQWARKLELDHELERLKEFRARLD